MCSIILHVGPPKTATTALQHFYQNADLAKYNAVYLGCFQPRKEYNLKGDNELIRQMLKYAKEPSEEFKYNIIKQIDKYFEQYSTIVLSEEMLLCGENYNKRMNNVHHIIKNYNSILLVCLRDIRKGFPSYYGEIFNSLNGEYQNKWEKFEQSDHRHLYDYSIIDRELSGNFDIKYIEFDKLVGNQYKIKDVLPGATNSNDKVIVGKQNKKKREYNDDKIKIEYTVDLYKKYKCIRLIYKIFRKIRVNKLANCLKNNTKIKKSKIVVLSAESMLIHTNNQRFLNALKR